MEHKGICEACGGMVGADGMALGGEIEPDPDSPESITDERQEQMGGEEPTIGFAEAVRRRMGRR